MPHGGFDAWAIWNVKAKMLYYHPEIAFSYPVINHASYPPLQPALIALGFHIAGDSVAVPIFLHGAVFFATLWLLRSCWWGLLIAGITILPFAASQFADLPLALSLLCAVAAFQSRHAGQVGLALGLGLLIKNEGLMIAGIFMAIWTVSERRIPWRALLAMAPFLVMLILFKVMVNVPNDVLSAEGIIERLMTPERYAWVAVLGLLGLTQFGTGAFAVLFGAGLLARRRLKLSVPLMTLALVLLAYLGIYVITYWPIGEHMQVSYDRLILHLFPALVFLIVNESA